jgi:hypothetical protein
MKVLFINEFGNYEMNIMKAVPRVGDRVDVFGWNTAPTVTIVLWCPTGKHRGFSGLEVDVVITV